MYVSMKSGLEDRNNLVFVIHTERGYLVSMKSGLEDRNNLTERIWESNSPSQ